MTPSCPPPTQRDPDKNPQSQQEESGYDSDQVMFANDNILKDSNFQNPIFILQTKVSTSDDSDNTSIDQSPKNSPKQKPAPVTTSKPSQQAIQSVGSVKKSIVPAQPKLKLASSCQKTLEKG